MKIHMGSRGFTARCSLLSGVALQDSRLAIPTDVQLHPPTACLQRPTPEPTWKFPKNGVPLSSPATP